jgi:hypothetical protein
MRYLQVFILLEKEIEDSLPQFQEMILSLRSVTVPDYPPSANIIVLS